MTNQSNQKLQNAHPGLDLERVLARFERLRTGTKNTSHFTRATLMKELGFSGTRNGAGHTLISAIVHFGLLKKDDSDYLYSDLANKLFSEHDRMRPELIRQAALSPELYKMLFNKYGLSLPSDIGDQLIRSYKKRNITPDNVKQVLINYQRTMEYAGMKPKDASGESPSTTPQPSSISSEYVEIDFLGNRAVVYKQYLREAIERTQAKALEALQ